MSDFPSEYDLHSVQKLRRNFRLHKSHEFAIYAEEPSPLLFSRSETASAAVKLRLIYRRTTINAHSNREVYPPPPLPNTFFVVHSDLMAITSISITSQSAVPRQDEAEPSRLHVKQSKVCSTQIRKFQVSSWEPVVIGENDDGGKRRAFIKVSNADYEPPSLG